MSKNVSNPDSPRCTCINNLIAAHLYQYFLKIVPTKYHYLGVRQPLSSYQYSVTQYERAVPRGPSNMPFAANRLPGAFFTYDISPLEISYKEEKPSFLSFLVGICAAVGGVVTIAGLIDRTLYKTQNLVKLYSLPQFCFKLSACIRSKPKSI